MIRKIADYTFQNNLKHIRQNGEIPLAVLADRIGISRQALYEIENDKKLPSLLTAYKLAWYFNKRIEDIFNFYVEETPESPEIIRQSLTDSP